MKNHSLHREGIVGWLFVMPSILGFLAFVLIPVLVSVFISFTSWDIISGLSNIQFIGISNFKQLFEDSMFIKSLQNNLVYTVLFVPSTMILALLIALAMNQKIYGRNMLRALFFIPFITNIVAISIVWMALFHPYSGPINKLLEALGMQNPPMWLMKRSSALPSITVVNVWFHMGYAMVIFLNGLQTVPRDLYEAADIDGAGPVRKFFSHYASDAFAYDVFHSRYDDDRLLQGIRHDQRDDAGRAVRRRNNGYRLLYVPDRLPLLPHGICVGHVAGAFPDDLYRNDRAMARSEKMGRLQFIA